MFSPRVMLCYAKSTLIPRGIRVPLWLFLFCTLCGAWLGDIDLELVLSQGIVVEHADCLVGVFLCGHGHESEALRLAGALIHGDFDRRDGSSGCEQGVDFILCGRLVQISYVNSYIHFVLLSTREGIVRHCRNKNDREPYKRVGGQGVRQRSCYFLLIQCSTLSAHRRMSIWRECPSLSDGCVPLG